MTEQAERRRLIIAWTIVLGAAVAHRVVLYLLHRTELESLVVDNMAWYPFQYLPQEMLRDHLVAAMLLLQQTPPVPNLLMGIALKTFAWPVGVAKFLIVLQSLVSVLTAAVLVHLLAVLYPRRVVLWTAIGLLFVLSTDLVVLEYTSMGQLIYGPLAMLLTLVVVDRLAALRSTGWPREAAAAGAAAGLLALSHATWSYFGLPCVVLAAVLARRQRMRAVLACLMAILVLQGGWALKNWAVYGVLSPATSSWGGMHTVNGFTTAGFTADYFRFFGEQTTREHGAPEWAVEFAHGDQKAALDRLKADVGERDARVERLLGLSNPLLNTLFFREFCAQGERVAVAFAWRHPR